MKRNALKNYGFTMIEIVVVLIVLFIISAVVLSRFSTVLAINSMVEAETLKSNLRYAEIRALGDTLQPTGRPRWEIVFPNATTYTLYRIDDNGNQVPVNMPSETPPSPTHILPAGVSISFTSTTVAFDDWSRPLDGSGNPWTESKTITIMDNTGVTTFTITKNTGFIQ